MERTEVFMRSLAARPPEDEPLTAIRNSYHDSLAEHATAPGDAGEKLAIYLSVISLIEVTPALLAANLRRPRLLATMLAPSPSWPARNGGRRAAPAPES